MGGIDNNHIHTRRNQQLDTLIGVCPHPDGCANPKAAIIIFAGIGVLGRFLDVLDRHHALQVEIVVDDKHLLNTVFMQQRLDLVCRGTLFRP